MCIGIPMLVVAIAGRDLGRAICRRGEEIHEIDMTLVGAILIEALLTFFLALVVMGTLVDPAAPKVGGFGVGLALWMCVLAAYPLTGAALNPARAFGPAPFFFPEDLP